jgi:hypothetical protein
MNRTELVAHRLSTPLIRPSLVRIKPQCWRWCSHSQRSEGSYISQGAKRAMNSATILSGRALCTVPEAMELNLSRTVIYKQVRSSRLLTVTQLRRRLVPASFMTVYVDLLVTKTMARTNAHTP